MASLSCLQSVYCAYDLGRSGSLQPLWLMKKRGSTNRADTGFAANGTAELLTRWRATPAAFGLQPTVFRVELDEVIPARLDSAVTRGSWVTDYSAQHEERDSGSWYRGTPYTNVAWVDLFLRCLLFS